MYRSQQSGNVLLIILGILIVIVIGVVAAGIFFAERTIYELLTENKHLKAAISNLTDEDQIGYAKVISKNISNGKILTTLKFVETARDEPLNKILEQTYTIEGDEVYFDALIITFDTKMVADGKKRSLYLWRRIYGKYQPPAQGFPIEESGKEPTRYSDLLENLRISDRELFWSEVWSLANDPDKLKDYGIKAISGHAVYQNLKPGLIYVFKISRTGYLYPEVIPDL